MSVMKKMFTLLLSLLTLFFSCKGDETVVPQKLANSTLAVLRNGKNWPVAQTKDEQVYALAIVYYNSLGSELNFDINRTYGANYTRIEHLLFNKLARKVGKLPLASLAKRLANKELSSVIYTIGDDDQADATYYAADDYESFIELTDYDEAKKQFKVKFDLKLIFNGNDDQWKNAQRNKLVVDRVMTFKGETICNDIYFNERK